MLQIIKRLVNGGRLRIRALGIRSIERNFQKADDFRCAPVERLSDFILIRGHGVLIREIADEANLEIRQQLVNSLFEIENELKKRNLIDRVSIA